MPRQVRPIRVCGDVAYVTLTQGHEAIIDAADVSLVDKWNWYAGIRAHLIYAVRSDRIGQNKITVLMHRVIMRDPVRLHIDHEDGDGLNNRRYNVRIATPSQNMHNMRTRCDNTSGFKGVHFSKSSGKWMARIKLNQKTNYLGLFASPEDAHAAYCLASDKYHGEFGRTE
jgi:hypothetical protein